MARYPFAMPSYGVFALIFDQEGRLLIKQRTAADAKWDLPGGGRDQRETCQLETLAREVDEEVSLEISLLECVILGHPLPMALNSERIDLAQPFVVEAWSGSPQTGPECANIMWVSIKEVRKMLTERPEGRQIVSPVDRVGRTPRMMLDGLVTRKEAMHTYMDHGGVPANYECKQEQDYTYSQDKLFIIRRYESGVRAWRRVDPFSKDGLFYPS